MKTIAVEQDKEIHCPLCNFKMEKAEDGSSIHCGHTVVVATDEGFAYIHESVLRNLGASNLANADSVEDAINAITLVESVKILARTPTPAGLNGYYVFAPQSEG